MIHISIREWTRHGVKRLIHTNLWLVSSLSISYCKAIKVRISKIVANCETAVYYIQRCNWQVLPKKTWGAGGVRKCSWWLSKRVSVTKIGTRLHLQTRWKSNQYRVTRSNVLMVGVQAWLGKCITPLQIQAKKSLSAQWLLIYIWLHKRLQDRNCCKKYVHKNMKAAQNGNLPPMSET